MLAGVWESRVWTTWYEGDSCCEWSVADQFPHWLLPSHVTLQVGGDGESESCLRPRSHNRLVPVIMMKFKRIRQINIKEKKNVFREAEFFSYSAV